MGNIAIFRINYKSDFVLTLNSDAGWMTPFCIKFWTGAPSQAYFVGWDGTTYTNCAPVAGEPTKLQVQFDDHHLPVGELKYQIGYHFTVADFPNDTEDEVLNQERVIIEIDGHNEKVMLDFKGETAPDIQFSLPAYANEAQRIANEEQRIENEQQRIDNEQQRIDNEQTRQRNEGTRIENEQQRVQEFGQMKGDLEQATRDAAAAAENANEKGVYAKNQGDYAKQQGDYAKQQGDTAKADHERAEEDHRIAGEDHTQAGSDHTRAGEDHTQAGSDHTRAGEDHTRAESDHTRAESDHAAVEVYVDSLGAFDISAYHATGGVLAKYADLSAALGTNGANIPDALRKGGMSVKFVLSYDNKYVQYFLIKNEWSVNVVDWQKLNLKEEVSQSWQEMAGLIDDIENLVLLDNYYFTTSSQVANDDWYEGILIPYDLTKTYTLECPDDLTSSSPQKVGAFASNKTTRTDYKGYSNGRTLSNFSSGTAYIALSVRKADAHKFAVYENGVEVFRGSETIQNNIPKLRESVETLAEKIESERELYKLVGAGSTYIRTRIQLIKGRKYQIVFDNPSWARNATGTDSGQNIFVIHSIVGSSSTTIFRVTRGEDTGTLEKSYEFDVPANTDILEFGGRANVGTDIVFSLEDITEITNEITNVRTDFGVPINSLTFEIARPNGYVAYNQQRGAYYKDDKNWYVGKLIPVAAGDEILINIASDIDTDSSQKLGSYDSNGKLYSYYSIYNGRLITMSSPVITYIALSTRITDAPLFKLTVNGVLRYQGSNAINLSVPAIYKQVEQIEEKIEPDDIYNRNTDKLPLLFASANKNLRLQFLIATDSHEGWGALQNAVDFANKCEYIQALFVLGDCTGQAVPSLSTFEQYNQIINTCTKPVFCVAGNHDCGYDKRLRYTALEDKVCEYIIEPTYQHLAVGEYTQGKAYYYHDFVDKKVRAIFLYEFDEPISIVENSYWEAVAFDSTKPQYTIGVQYAVDDIVNFGLYTANSFKCIQAHTSSAENEIILNEYRGYRFIGQTQMAWLVSTMLSTPSDYNIIICTHIPASSDYSNTLFSTSKFCIKFVNELNGFNGMADDYLGILAEAYNNGANGTIKVSGKDTFAYLNVLEDAGAHYAYEISYDFSGKNSGAKFVCFFSGHTHVDCVFKNPRNQFCITPTFTTATTRQFNTNDVPRNSDPKELAYDALTAVALDTTNNCVVLTRVGTTGTTHGYLRDVDRIDII